MSTTQPVSLRRDGKVEIGGHVFDVNNIRTDNVMVDHVNGEQTVELTVVLTRPIPKQPAPGKFETEGERA